MGSYKKKLKKYNRKLKLKIYSRMKTEIEIIFLPELKGKNNDLKLCLQQHNDYTNL